MKVHGRTNILNGLTKVLEILKQDKKSENNNELMEEMRVEITMLLSDEYDNDYNTEEIVIEVKIIIKGKNLAFTLIFLVMEKIIILNWWVNKQLLKMELFLLWKILIKFKNILWMHLVDIWVLYYKL